MFNNESQSNSDIEKITEKLNILEKENKILKSKIIEIENSDIKLNEPVIENKTDLRLVMLLLSLVGLCATAIYLFYRD